MMFNLFPRGLSGRKRKGNRSAQPGRSLKKLSIEWLESRQMMSVNLGSLPNIQVPGGKSVLVPLTGIDSLGGPITYSFSATDPQVQLSLQSPNSKSISLNVSGVDGNSAPFTGTIIVKLFEDLAPGTTSEIEELVTSGFYNGLDFHRILDGFVAQAGANSGTTLDDEFSALLTFNSPGLLAMANTGDSDTAGSQFFISAIDTAGTTDSIPLAEMPQFLNLRYTIFGQLVSGFDTFAQMMSTDVENNPNIPNEVSKPTNTLTITSASVITDTQNAVLRVFIPDGTSGGTITVTATNGAQETSEQMFTATAVADTQVDPPFLGAIGDMQTPAGVAKSFQLNSTNLETGAVYYDMAVLGGDPATATFTIDHATGAVTVTPVAGYVGPVEIVVGVRSETSNFDTQRIALNVLAPMLDPLADQNTALGRPIQGTLNSTDPTGNGVFFNLFEVTGTGDSINFVTPQHITFNINQATGAILITPNAGFTGTVELVAAVRDLASPDIVSNYTGEFFSLTVTAPVLEPISDKTTSLGVSTTFVLGITDPTNGALLYSVIDANTGLAPTDVDVTIDPLTKQVTLAPHAGFTGEVELIARIRAAGSADVPENIVSQAFSLNVVAPTLGTVTNKTTAIGAPEVFTFTSTDPGGSGLIYSVVDAISLQAPQNVTVGIDPATKQVTLTPQSGIIGNRSLLLRARAAGSADVADNYVTQSFTFSIEAPTIADVTDKTINANQPLVFQLSSTIPGGGTPFYSVVFAAQSLTNATIQVSPTGQVTITPSQNFTGTLNFVARVRDASSPDVSENYREDTFSVTVNSVVTLNDPTDISVPGTKSVLVPLTGVDSAGKPISYTFSSANANVQLALVSQASRSLKLTVSGTDKNGQAFTGTIVLKLFEDLAPATAARIIQLVQQNPSFYAGQLFHRIVDGFVAQAGSNSGVKLNDEFNAGLTFNSAGLLAMANAGRDTSDAQFFITDTDAGLTAPLQNLNYRFTIFGQLVSGFDIFTKMMSVQTTANPNIPGENSKPVNNITITAAEVFTDTQNQVLRVTLPAGFSGEADITVTGTSTGGGTATQTFKATAVADTIAEPPFLGAVGNQTTTATTPVNFNLTSTNVDNVPITYKIVTPTFGTPANVTISINQATGQVTLTPAAGFKGTINLLAAVRATSAADTSANYDTQAFTLTVNANPAINPTLGNVANQSTSIGVPVVFNLTSTDTGANGVFYKVADATTFGNPANVTVSINQATGQVTLTPAAGFTGTVNLIAGVRQTGAADEQANYNTKTFTLTVSAVPVAPTGISVDSVSNTGKFDGNGYVSTDTPTLRVTAKAGSTVRFKLGGVVIATATETAANSGIYTAKLPAGKLAVGTNAITAAVTDAGGTSADSTALNIVYGHNYAGGTYMVPGAVGSTQKVAFAWTERRAAYNNEIGFFIANADGSVGNIRPGQGGYAQAALSSSTRRVIFAKGSTKGANVEINLKGGQVVVFYMVQNNTTANFLANNPANANNGNNNPNDPLAFFSIKAANPDGQRHAQIIADPTTGRVQYNWEDLAGLGDSDFNDVVMTVRLASHSNSNDAFLKVPGAGNTTVSLKALFEGGKVNAATGDVGVFIVDNADGSIGTLKPGDPGYAAVALAAANVRVLVAAGASAAANATVPAGKYLGFYSITNGTTATFRAANPTNASGGATNALFSFNDANPDGQTHFRWFSPGQQQTSPDGQQLHIMNQLGGKEDDFDSFRLNLSFDS